MTSSDRPCTLTLPDGKHYDLSSLGSANADYTAEVGETSYKLNVCRGVVSELWHLDHPEDIGGFISRPDGDFSLGRTTTNLTLSPTNEPLLVLQHGSPCPLNPSENASTAIRFICSPSDFHAGIPKLIVTIPADDPAQACHFFFEWSTYVACPTNAKNELQQGHYIAFGVILAIAFFTWLGGQTLYNRFYLKRRGRDQFPFSSLHLPGFSRSGHTGPSLPGLGSFRRRSQRAGYSGIRAEENDEDEGFARRFSLEEDDEDAEDLTGQRVGALGEEANAWRGAPNGQANGVQQGKVGVHQGLVDV